jgi:phospholipid N-methyltransferase
MKNTIKTSLEFTKNILVTGAFKETSRRVELEITSKLPTAANQVIVEFGMGHGNITKEILQTISPTSKLFAFEVNEEFCDYVASQIKDDRLVIVNDGAENLAKHVGVPVHAFVSSIPFTFFSKEMSRTILEGAYGALESGHYFHQVLYSKAHVKKFKSVFDEVKVKTMLNIPLECIYYCKKW